MKPFGIFLNVILIYEIQTSKVYYDVTDENKIWIEKMKPFGIFLNVILIYETQTSKVYYDVTDEIN